MNNFFRALIAGAAAKKFGGGCLGTIVIFVLVWVALGQCSSRFTAPENTAPPIKEKTYTQVHLQTGSSHHSAYAISKLCPDFRQ